MSTPELTLEQEVAMRAVLEILADRHLRTPVRQTPEDYEREANSELERWRRRHEHPDLERLRILVRLEHGRLTLIPLLVGSAPIVIPIK